MIARDELESGDDDQKGPSRPNISEYDIHADLLTALINEMKSTRATIIGAVSGSNPQVDYLRGPEYALEKMRLKMREMQHNALAARLLPHKYPNGPVDVQ